MFTEQRLQGHPSLIKMLMSISTQQYWDLVEQMRERQRSYTRQQHQHTNQQDAVGGGRDDLPLGLRTAVVSTYLRVHIRQTIVAALFADMTQSESLARSAPFAAPHSTPAALPGALGASYRRAFARLAQVSHASGIALAG